jgi:hypothetical protein
MKKSTIIIAAIFLIGMSLSPQVDAQDTTPKDPYSGDLLTRSTLTGDWGGLRNEWAAKGVTIDLNVTQVGQGVVSGGKSSAWQYAGGATLRSMSIARSLACGRADFSISNWKVTGRHR